MNILITEIELKVIQYHITNCILLHTVYITREIKSLCFTYGNPAIVYVMHDCIYVMSDMTNSKVRLCERQNYLSDIRSEKKAKSIRPKLNLSDQYKQTTCKVKYSVGHLV